MYQDEEEVEDGGMLGKRRTIIRFEPETFPTSADNSTNRATEVTAIKSFLLDSYHLLIIIKSKKELGVEPTTFCTKGARVTKTPLRTLGIYYEISYIFSNIYPQSSNGR